jgi:hypothetical protein
MLTAFMMFPLLSMIPRSDKNSLKFLHRLPTGAETARPSKPMILQSQ